MNHLRLGGVYEISRTSAALGQCWARAARIRSKHRLTDVKKSLSGA